MSCGCGGSRPYHPSTSYHWNGAGGGTNPSIPAAAPQAGEELAIDRGQDEEAQAQAQSERASAPAAADDSFPLGWVLVALVAFVLLRRAS